MRELVADIDFDAATPRSLSWLATTLILVNQAEMCLDVYNRAVIAHPQDFMLAMDCAGLLASPNVNRLQEAIRMYHRCVVIRPDVGGLWRNLGVAYREVDELEHSLDALTESIRVQPDHAPTYVDRGVTLAQLENFDEAIADYRKAIAMQPDLAAAHCHLGRALQAQGRLEEALRELERGHELGLGTAGWTLPSAEWIEECEALISESAENQSQGES